MVLAMIQGCSTGPPKTCAVVVAQLERSKAVERHMQIQIFVLLGLSTAPERRMRFSNHPKLHLAILFARPNIRHTMQELEPS
jgi:hypothetical protein